MILQDMLQLKSLVRVKVTIRHVLNEERTGFELRPQSIYGLMGQTEAPFCQIARYMFTNRLSIQSIDRCENKINLFINTSN